MASDVTTSTIAGPTSTSDTNTNDVGNCSLSSNAKVGLIAGSVGVGLLILISALHVFFCLRYRRRRYKDDEVRYTQLGHPGHPSIHMASSELETPSNVGMRIPAIADTRRHPSDTPSARWWPCPLDRRSFALTSDLYQPQASVFVHEMPARRLQGHLVPSSVESATEMTTAASRLANVHLNPAFG